MNLLENYVHIPYIIGKRKRKKNEKMKATKTQNLKVLFIFMRVYHSRALRRALGALK